MNAKMDETAACVLASKLAADDRLTARDTEFGYSLGLTGARSAVSVNVRPNGVSISAELHGLTEAGARRVLAALRGAFEGREDATGPDARLLRSVMRGDGARVNVSVPENEKPSNKTKRAK